jgi:hypothetical protein
MLFFWKNQKESLILVISLKNKSEQKFIITFLQQNQQYIPAWKLPKKTRRSWLLNKSKRNKQKK